MNKKISFFLLAFLLGLSQVKAQKGLEVGLIVMPQVSAMYSKTWWEAGDEQDYLITLKGAAGVQVALNLTNNIGIGGGMLYSLQGQHFTTGANYALSDSMGNSVDIPKRKFGFDLLYYKVPVFLKLNTNIQAKVSFVFMAGLQLGLLQKATFFDKGADINGVTIFSPQSLDLTTSFEEQDISAMVAFDGRYNISPKMHISLLLRGDYSLRTIAKPDPISSTAEDIRNINLGVQLGLHYVIGR